MELCPPLHQSVVAIEKAAFRSPLTKIANFTFTYRQKLGLKKKKTDYYQFQDRKWLYLNN